MSFSKANTGTYTVILIHVDKMLSCTLQVHVYFVSSLTFCVERMETSWYPSPPCLLSSTKQQFLYCGAISRQKNCRLNQLGVLLAVGRNRLKSAKVWQIHCNTTLTGSIIEHIHTSHHPILSRLWLSPSAVKLICVRRVIMLSM